MRKRNHPYYMLWWERKRDGTLCPEWMDFGSFVADIGERPSQNHFLMRRGDAPFGPTNFFWVEKLRKRPDETKKEWWARKWRARQLANPSLERRRMFVRKYGLTLEQYEELLADQGGKCAICGQFETSFCGRSGSRRNLCVDHCHATGKVRALLCFRCNSTIGKIEESPQLLLAMSDYLQKYSAA